MVITSGTPKCEDKRVDCSHLKVPYCVSHKKRMTEVCAKTCGYCKDGDNPFSRKQPRSIVDGERR